MRYIFFLLFSGVVSAAFSQPVKYTVSNAHSHNDYEQKVPFWTAYNEGFGSIEADIFLDNDSLYIAHNTEELKVHRTLRQYYIEPLINVIKQNNGYVYKDSSKHLQLLIDLKTDSVQTLNVLIVLLKQYPTLINNHSIQFVITGNRPDQSQFTAYPAFIWFDGELYKDYSKEALTRIVMLSDDLSNYSHWNGKGNPPEKEWTALTKAVNKAHSLGKKVRFWDAPDFTNAWYQFMHLGVDYINTDHIVALATFLNNLPKTTYTSTSNTYATYQPTYKTDGIDKPVKNLILLIADGTSYAQLYTGYTANKGTLNIFNMRNIGISKTSSYDNFITDSGPGSTAIASGAKTNNRFVGADHTGAPLTLLPAVLAKRNIKTGLVTCGDIADATPADFYAHQSERDDATAVLKDLENASIDILMGSGNESLENVDILKASDKAVITESVIAQLQKKYSIVSAIDSVKETADKKWIVIDKKAGLSELKGRGDWLQKAFAKTVQILSKNKAGFFLMTEGAQVDYGGHANNIAYVATELMDFDKTVGAALRFADTDGQTLVIVTADHETGGLTLLDGDYSKGYISGQFASNDHTALPVPVFAYGPQSFRFRGVYENTALFSKILEAYGIAK
ncbi:alkaline phosphatase [Ilyomonas limi]|uniref:Alkaline phosphatase n=1 Tax=Ilyomonas limi TaxID=2575867 RepID=A0A4U3L6Y6_9BACT|nr:alkaline phosphatase [Ilyomonas limi]TKK71015.1 alkaline phosphatase [Ilyomonas limi]